MVAEFVAGTGGTQSGLAYRILESAYRLRIPRVFAALVLISLTGIAIFLAVGVGSSHANERAKNALWGMVAAAALSGSYKLIADTLVNALRAGS